MPYDIYGQSLRSGHCEVHPDVHQEYPCYLCVTENQQRQEHMTQQRQYEEEYYEQYCKDMIADLIIDSFTTARNNKPFHPDPKTPGR